jgi:hypothetical protein
MPHSIVHGNACSTYFNKIWGIPSRAAFLISRMIGSTLAAWLSAAGPLGRLCVPAMYDTRWTINGGGRNENFGAME